MHNARTTIWTVIGAIVGAFLMPSTWLMLIYLTAGRAFVDNFNNADSLADDLGAGIDFGSDSITSTTTPTPDVATSSTPGWVTALLIVSLAVTVLSAVFFGWVGHRLATREEAMA